VSGQTTGRKPSGVDQTGILFLDNNAWASGVITAIAISGPISF